MKNTIKVRTFLGQAIDTFKEYIKTKGNLQTDYPLEIYMQEILDYIDYLEKENQRLNDRDLIIAAELTKLQDENKQLTNELDRYKWCNPKKVEIIQFEELQQKHDKQLDNWNKLIKQVIDRFNKSQDIQFLDVLQDMQELEQGSDSNE